MRILHIIGTLDPQAGGPAQSIKTLLSYKELGYIGEAVTFDPPDAPFLRDLPFPATGTGPVSGTFGYTPRLIPWIEANLHRFDAVILSGLWTYISLAVLRAVRGKKPYMVLTHGMLDPYFKRAYPLKHIKKAVFWYTMQYWVLRGAHRVLFTTQTEADLARKSFALSSWTPQVIPYGSPGPAHDRETSLAAFHHAVANMQGKRFLLFLGRIHRKKGCDLLLDAFVRVASSDPGLHLVMAGPDQQGWAAELQLSIDAAGLTDRVHWVGTLTGDAKWGAFYACEAFILPSHQENFGIAVAEALACGCAVLVSDQVNIAPEIVADGCGYMEPDTMEGTERLLVRWIATPTAQRDAMQTQALATFHARYDNRETAHAILRLVESAQ